MKQLHSASDKDCGYWQNASGYNNEWLMYKWIDHLVEHSGVGKTVSRILLLIVSNA